MFAFIEKFKSYFANREQRRLEKYAAMVKNPRAIREDRAAAIDAFHGLAVEHTEFAVKALLQRFEYSLEHGINDTREKESAMAGILEYGKVAIPFVVEHLKGTLRIAWPIKIVTQLGDKSELVEILKGALAYGDVSFDQAVVDKNYDILCYLRDFQIGDDINKVAGFLKDPDERVRFACAEVVAEQTHASSPQHLEPFLVDLTPDNRRVHVVAVEAFVRNGWPLVDRAAFGTAEFRPQGVRLSDEGRLTRV